MLIVLEYKIWNGAPLVCAFPISLGSYTLYVLSASQVMHFGSFHFSLLNKSLHTHFGPSPIFIVFVLFPPPISLLLRKMCLHWKALALKYSLFEVHVQFLSLVFMTEGCKAWSRSSGSMCSRISELCMPLGKRCWEHFLDIKQMKAASLQPSVFGWYLLESSCALLSAHSELQLYTPQGIFRRVWVPWPPTCHREDQTLALSQKTWFRV